ncbi:MAG: F0F1 ATP synthase subunit gamma [Alphaproteobacteria bacterium]|nr:F0F1 ATP synthase subunit gamma [Alphaproteobacteria bacterium]
MPSLKDLKVRIESVKSTRKITSAMKMVAASKLRRAQEQAEAGRPYAEAMMRIMGSLTANLVVDSSSPKLLGGTGKSDVIALVVVTSDRGLCGAFNSSIVRETRRQIKKLRGDGKQVRLICIGRKGRDQLRREFSDIIIAHYEDVGRRKLAFTDADHISKKIQEMYEAGVFDEAHLVYNRFKNVLTQIVTQQQVIPVPVVAIDAAKGKDVAASALYEFEPDEGAILADLLPKNISVMLYRALLESAAGEQGARMNAMDNATRNAGDMIGKLSLQYNRARQAYITREMIEIVTGAEAV